jgi:hypothetical protein
MESKAQKIQHSLLNLENRDSRDLRRQSMPLVLSRSKSRKQEFISTLSISDEESPNIEKIEAKTFPKIKVNAIDREIEDLVLKPKVELDRCEPVIIASFLLPYTILRKCDGTLTIQKCIHNPTMLYGTLENMMQKKQFNFHWVGLVTTLEDMNTTDKLSLVS